MQNTVFFKEKVNQEEIDIKKRIRIVMQFLWAERKTAATISISIIKVSHKRQQKQMNPFLAPVCFKEKAAPVFIKRKRVMNQQGDECVKKNRIRKDSAAENWDEP